MQASNLARLIVFAVLTVAVALEAAAPVVIPLAMVGTASGAAYRPASCALLPALVGESRLAPAMAFCPPSSASPWSPVPPSAR